MCQTTGACLVNFIGLFVDYKEIHSLNSLNSVR